MQCEISPLASRLYLDGNDCRRRHCFAVARIVSALVTRERASGWDGRSNHDSRHGAGTGNLALLAMGTLGLLDRRCRSPDARGIRTVMLLVENLRKTFVP